MKFETIGVGEPLVLVHGALSDMRMWHAVVAPLSRQYRVYTITQRFFFDAAPVDGEDAAFGYEMHAYDLIEFLLHEIRQPARVVGWSYGADVTLLAATMCPDAISAAVLYELGRHTHIQGPALDAYFADATASFGRIATILAEQGIEPALTALIDNSGGAVGYFQRQADLERRIQLDNAYTLPLQLHQLPSREVTREAIGELRMPLCFARGERTAPVFAIATDEAYRCARDAQHRVVAGATHMWPIEAPHSFSEFVASCFAAR